MLLLYNFGISLYWLILKFASLFHPKAKLFVAGRRDIFEIMRQKLDHERKHIWFHFASLGEFEQGRPVLEKLNKIYPDKPIVVTFFSPSGYEIRKNYQLAEGIFYLPLDSRQNAAKLISLINPEIAIFTKYEFWHHYFKALKVNNTPLLLISGIFRPNQVFFKWYGGFYRDILKNVQHFFVQNEESKLLLAGLGIHQVSVSGDTRFDRVAELAVLPQQLKLLQKFSADSRVFIAGSTWPHDEKLIAGLQQQNPDWKFIIAPHEIDSVHIDQVRNLFPGALLYTSLKDEEEFKPQNKVLILDTIGILSSAYQYGTLGYIGGGFGAGIHNTLEAAAFGLPVIFGPQYEKFQEAKDLLQLGAAVSIMNGEDLSAAFNKLQKDPDLGARAIHYIAQKKGATLQIVEAVKELI